MEGWVSLAMHVLWRNAMAAIPLVVIVTAVCRWVPCRASTRHALWLIALLWFAASSVLPTSRVLSRLAARVVPAETADALPHGVNPASEEGTLKDNRSSSVASSDATEDSPHVRDGASRLNERSSNAVDGRESPLHARRIARAAAPRTISDALPVAVETAPAKQPLIPDVDAERFDALVQRAAEQVAGHSPGGEIVFGPARRERAIGSRPGSPGFVATQPPPPETTVALRFSGHWGAAGHPSADAPTPGGAATWMRLQPPTGSGSPIHPSKARTPSIMELKSSETGERSDGQEATPAVATTRSDPGAYRIWRDWVNGWLSVRDSVGRLSPIPTRVWLAGLGLCAVIAALRLACFRHRVGRACPAPPAVANLVKQCARAMGMRQTPQTMMVRRQVSPMVWCGRRVRLVLPEGLWADLDDTGRRAVVCHELAHVRRRDHWVHWVQLVVCALYWWDPLVWWVRRRLNEEAEFCCDAWVTWLFPRQRRAYAEALLKTKQYVSRPARAVPPMGIGVTTGRASRFARRIQMVMTETPKPRLSLSGAVLATVLAAAGWITTPAISCPKEKTVAKSAADCAPECKGDCHAKCTAQCRSQCTLCQCKCSTRCAPAAAPSAAGAFVPVPEGVNTYQWYLQSRTAPAGRAKERPAPAFGGTGLMYAPLAPTLAANPGPMDRGNRDQMAQRLKELERQIQRMNEQIARIRDGLKMIESAAPRATHPESIRGLFEAPPAPPAPDARPTPGPDRTEWRDYRVSAGKLQALSELMVRDDVPIMVSPQGDHIRIQGTLRQHEIIGAFIRLIEPGAESPRAERHDPESSIMADIARAFMDVGVQKLQHEYALPAPPEALSMPERAAAPEAAAPADHAR